MNQSTSLYDTSAALALIDPWLRANLPNLDEALTRRFIQLVTGIFEERSLLLETIAQSTAFCGTDSSNVTRIIRDVRITLKDVFYPLLERLIAELPNEVLYLTMDETSHHTDYCVVQIWLATDGVSLPLSFHIYAPDATWADDARELLDAIDDILPHRCRIELLADRDIPASHFSNAWMISSGTTSFGPPRAPRLSIRPRAGCHSSGSTSAPTKGGISRTCGSGSKASGGST
jgi:hypothetical protein